MAGYVSGFMTASFCGELYYAGRIEGIPQMMLTKLEIIALVVHQWDIY